MSVIVYAFYKFTAIADCEALRLPLQSVLQENGVKGTVLIAPEGINATISGRQGEIERVLGWLSADPRFSDLVFKRSHALTHPFGRLKVKIKPEIIRFGVPEANPATQAGEYVSPQHWNGLIQDPDVLVLDTRNAYEVAIGTFQNAADPKIDAFRLFPAYAGRHLSPARHAKVAMFCTGGIRCEKASAYLLLAGFRSVYHLQGGILNYLECVPHKDSLWRGECFVFDERVALNHDGAPGTHGLCLNCGYPVAAASGTASGAAGKARCSRCDSGTSNPALPPPAMAVSD